MSRCPDCGHENQAQAKFCSERGAVMAESAARAFASGDFGAAAAIYESMGAVSDEARDRLLLAESLIGRGRGADADIEVQRALAFYRPVGTTRYIRQGEALRGIRIASHVSM